MVRASCPLALSAVAIAAAGCIDLHFNKAAVPQVAAGLTQQQVVAIVGPPQHMIKLLEHPKHCVEGWSYVDFTPGLPPRVEELIVDFDDQGKVCDLRHVIETPMFGIDVRLPPDQSVYQPGGHPGTQPATQAAASPPTGSGDGG